MKVTTHIEKKLDKNVPKFDNPKDLHGVSKIAL